MRSMKSLVEKAAKICGTQTAVAEKIGMRRQHLSNAKYGHMSIPPRAIKVLAEILDMDPAEIWIIQQQRLNPFGQRRASSSKR